MEQNQTLRPPRKLYRYRKFDLHATTEILLNELYFTNPINLNDPYDCHITITYEGGNQEDWEKYLKEIPTTTMENIFKSIKSSSRFASWDDNRIFSEAVSSCMRSPELREIFSNLLARDIMRVMNQRIGIASFSELHNDELHNDILLWSHYAAGHTGICIEYDTDKLLEIINGHTDRGIDRITYGEPRIPINYFSDIRAFSPEASNKYRLALFQKTKVWSYEKEYRMYINIYNINTDEERKIQLLPNSISTIFCGANFSESNMETLKELLMLKEDKPTLSRARLNKNNTLDFEIIDR